MYISTSVLPPPLAYSFIAGPKAANAKSTINYLVVTLYMESIEWLKYNAVNNKYTKANK